MLEEVVIGKKSVNSTDYRVDQAGISDNTFLPIMLRLPDASGHDRCHVMRAQGRIIISQYDLAFLWMRYNTGLKV